MALKDKIVVANSLGELLNPKEEKTPAPPLQASNLREGVSEIEGEEPPQVPPLSQILITRVALEKMFLLAEQITALARRPLEVYSLSIGQERIIKDILIPAQKVSYTSIFIEPQAILSLKPQIQENAWEILGWNHSHADFGVFFSHTDSRNQDVILAETSNYCTIENTRVKYCYGMTVNLHHDVFGRVSTQYSSGKIVHTRATLDFREEFPDDWDREKTGLEIRQVLEQQVINSGSLK